MAKITPLEIGVDTGTTAKTKIDEAMESVEVSAKFTGDGNTGTELDIKANAISNSELAQIAENIIKGRVTAGSGNVEDLTVSQVRTLLDVAYQSMTDEFNFGGQAHSGNNEATWSSGITFDADDGNIQEAVMTDSGTIALTNDSPGTYLLRIEIDSDASPTPTFDSSLGTELTNSTVAFDNSDNAVNIITVVHWASGAKEYTISN